MKQIAIVVMDAKNIPNIDGYKTVFTLEGQRVLNVSNTHVINIPSYVKLGDDVINLFVDRALHLPKKVEYQNMLEFVYFSHLVAFQLSQSNFDEVIFEDVDLEKKILMQFDNEQRYANKTALI